MAGRTMTTGTAMPTGRIIITVLLSFIILVIVGRFFGTSTADDGDIVTPLKLFAAASLTDVAQEFVAVYTRKTGQPITLNLASSSTLARQIKAGAAADLFLSANPRWVAFLGEAKRVTRKASVAGNALVLVSPVKGDAPAVTMDSDFSLGSIFEGRLAMGDPAHVPAGMYGKKALVSLGWWHGLENRLLPCANVREALLQVERGEVELGLVYRTDANRAKGVRMVGTFPAGSHPSICYTAALCTGANPAADALLDFILGPSGQSILTKHGFLLPEGR